MSSDHLNELRRQRELVQQQLQWLDREIARAETAATPSVPGKPVVMGSNPATTPSESAPLIIPDPDPLAASQDAKRGCLLSFVALLALLGALLVGLYFWKYRDRPVLFPERPASETSP